MWRHALTIDHPLLAGELSPEAACVMNEEKFQDFYQRTARPLWSYLHRISGDPTLAEDLLQEAYCRLLKASLRETEFDSLKAYLYRIATNLVTDHWRKHKREMLGGDDLPDSPVPSGRDQAILKTDLNRSLEKLRPQDRALLWLAYVEGCDHREIARRLGLRYKSVRVLLFRAKTKIGDILTRKGITGSRT